jgi:hypothetical protein
MKREKVKLRAATLSSGDVTMLTNALDYVGRDNGFKSPLIESLRAGYDHDHPRCGDRFRTIASRIVMISMATKPAVRPANTSPLNRSLTGSGRNPTTTQPTTMLAQTTK